jgi:uncharacterized membrane protein YcaP (DUF421 family)
MEIVIRASILFWVVWIITRALGKRELAELAPFELIVLIVTGDLIQQGVTQEDFSVTGASIAISVFALWATLLSFLSHRSKALRRALEGQPVIILRDGRLQEDALRYERITDDDVREAARQRGIPSLALIEVGILEPDGRFSFIRTDQRESDAGPPHHEV